jgi:hypothetical protein
MPLYFLAPKIFLTSIKIFLDFLVARSQPLIRDKALLKQSKFILRALMPIFGLYCILFSLFLKFWLDT